MARTITFSMELTDEEFSFFLNNRVAPALGNSNVAPVGGAENDEGQVNANAPAVDKNGIPWLEAVHAGTKAMNQDGTWRAKRGVDKAVVAAAEAAAKTNTGTNLSTGDANRVDPNAAQTAALAPATGGLPPMPGLPPVLPPPVAAEPPKPVSYEELSGLVQSVLTAGHTPDKITAIYAEVGLTDVNDLLTNETLRANLAGKLRSTFGIA